MKKNNILRLIIFGIFTCILVNSNAKANETDTTKTSAFNVSSALVSSYVWRGSMATSSPTPNFQTNLSFTKGNFEIGVWGSSDFIGSYKEVDPYLSLTAGKFKFLITDYNWDFDKADYFNYKNNETAHRVEAAILFSGTKVLPIGIMWNTMIYGFDKRSDDSTKQAFSTYIELGYSKGNVSFFLGFTPWASYYNNYGVTTFNQGVSKKEFSIVNIGASITKSIKINENYSLPLKATLAINPAATYTRMDFIHLVFDINF